MTKWIKRTGLAILILLIGLVIGAHFILKEAFRPKYRTVNIVLDESRTLIGKETYNADMAAVFYDVDFELKTKKLRTYELGSGTFPDEHWSKNIKLHEIADWIVLPVSDGSYSKLLLTDKITHQRIDTIFSPQNLRYDNLWKMKHADIPAWVYTGSSKIDSISGNKLYVTYEYRIGDYEPFKFYSQTIEHKIDTTTGNINTVTVFERKEIKNGR